MIFCMECIVDCQCCDCWIGDYYWCGVVMVYVFYYGLQWCCVEDQLVIQLGIGCVLGQCGVGCDLF